MVSRCNSFFELSPFTINLSDRVFSDHEISLLDRGLSFIPTVFRCKLADIYSQLDRNLRNLMLRDFFFGQDDRYDPELFEYKFIGLSDWSPSFSQLSLETQQAIFNIQNEISDFLDSRIVRHNNVDFVRFSTNKPDNLTVNERRAIQTLRSDSSIIIKPADKGGSIVIMNRNAYIAEAHRQLYDCKYYSRIPAPISHISTFAINSILDDMHSAGYITAKQLAFLHADIPRCSRSFYLLPKVHKSYDTWPSHNMPAGRPIVSDVGSETYKICQLIDYFLQPLANKHLSYVKDTYDFVQRIRNIAIPPDSLIVTGDITSLYTNMHIDLSLQVVRDQFLAHPDPHRPDELILKLLEICLRNNDFEFANEFFVQTLGTAMGKAFAPNLANLYLLKFDEAIFNGFPIKPLLFFRYIDDTFFVWPSTLERLKLFQDFVNNILPDITVSFNAKNRIIEFLDTYIYKVQVAHNTVLRTRVFFKNTDTHQLLHKLSFHPTHTCRGILKSQLIRFTRICSTFVEYKHAAYTLFAVLKRRGYSKSLFRSLLHSIWLSRSHYLIDRSKSVITRDQIPKWPIINFFDPIGTHINRLTRKFIGSLNISQSYRLISAYKIHRNLARVLTKSKVSAL